MRYTMFNFKIGAVVRKGILWGHVTGFTITPVTRVTLITVLWADGTESAVHLSDVETESEI